MGENLQDNCAEQCIEKIVTAFAGIGHELTQKPDSYTHLTLPTT